jgi:TonB family protein
MRNDLAKKWIPYSILLSILFHLLLIASFLVVLRSPEPKKSPQFYQPAIRAYTYTGAITPRSSPSQNKSTAQKSTPVDSGEQFLPAPKGNYAFANQSNPQRQKSTTPQKSILEMSQETLQTNQMNANLNRSTDEEPILLVGDEHAVADPLIKLIGRALSAHFNYPKMEGEFGVRGRVLVELTFHPEGNFTDASIVESSNNENFDAAALYAVNNAPKVIGADHFLEKPKHFVVGFIFN